MAQFQVRKNKFIENRLVETLPINDVQIAAGELLVKIDKFAYTSNNITYAVAGNMLGYWNFFPPKGENENEWGVIPVWGFADVVASNIEGIPVGRSAIWVFSTSGLPHHATYSYF